METQRFTRNPVEVEAVQVTPTNVAEVAKWCKGTHIETDYWLMGRTHKLGAIQLTKQGPKSDKTMTVLIGSWITRHKNIFKAWKHESFEQVYTPVGGGFAVGDLVRATNDSPFNGWEGKVADSHLVGVDFGSRGRIVFEPSWLSKIDEMDSIQLELNAGVEFEQSGDPVKSVLDEMRAASREKIEAMEKENLAYDDVIRVGDLVKIVKHPQVTQLSPYDGQCGHVSEIDENAPSADGPKPQYMVAFAKALDEDEFAPFEREELEKLRQDGEALNLASDENDLSGWESSDLDRLNDEKREEAEAVSDRPWDKLVSLNDLREDLGMARVPELEGVAPDEKALENYRIIKESLAGMTPDEVEKIKAEVVQLQGVIGRAIGAVEKPRFAKGERVEVLEGDDCWATGRKGVSMGELSDDGKLAVMMVGKDSPWWFDQNQLRRDVPLEVDDLVKVVGNSDGDCGLVTVVGCDPEGVGDSYIEVLFGGTDYQHHLPEQLYRVGHTYEIDAKPLEVGDLIETLVVHDFDGVTIPVGTNGRVVSFAVDVNTNHVDGVEIMFADGHYHSFGTTDIKKV